LWLISPCCFSHCAAGCPRFASEFFCFGVCAGYLSFFPCCSSHHVRPPFHGVPHPFSGYTGFFRSSLLNHDYPTPFFTHTLGILGPDLPTGWPSLPFYLCESADFSPPFFFPDPFLPKPDRRLNGRVFTVLFPFSTMSRDSLFLPPLVFFTAPLGLGAHCFLNHCFC